MFALTAECFLHLMAFSVSIYEEKMPAFEILRSHESVWSVPNLFVTSKKRVLDCAS